MSVCVMCQARKFLQFCRASIIVKLALAVPVRWRVGSNVHQRGGGRLQGPPLSRLSSILARELLNGHNVVFVRTKDLDISRSLPRNMLKFAEFKRNTRNSNPKLPGSSQDLVANHSWHDSHKTARGGAALDRLKSYPYDMEENMVIAQAYKVLRLRPECRFCRLGDLSTEFGWKDGDLVQRLEARSKQRAQVYHKKPL